MAQQLHFELPIKTAHGREDFFVSGANATSVAMIDGWRDWPTKKLALYGPTGAGKTHLTHVWAAQTNAHILAAPDLPQIDIAQVAQSHIAVEDVEVIAGQPDHEEALFHLHNRCLEEGNSLLLTASTAPNYWPLKLLDLASRMQATATTTIELPDDTLLAAILAKQFYDRQLSPAPEVITYLVRRIERSFQAARAIVATLDEAALDQKRAINRSLVRQVLDKVNG